MKITKDVWESVFGKPPELTCCYKLNDKNQVDEFHALWGDSEGKILTGNDFVHYDENDNLCGVGSSFKSLNDSQINTRHGITLNYLKVSGFGVIIDFEFFPYTNEAIRVQRGEVKLTTPIIKYLTYSSFIREAGIAAYGFSVDREAMKFATPFK